VSQFDASYYQRGCGSIPYGRVPEWLGQFARIAETLIAELNPQRVLDAGCAMGLLVEALRDRNVEAYGIDISDYAISQVAGSAKPYCRVGSITEPFGERFDLIVTMEVVEHMPPDQADLAIANMCAHSESVLFSSTPLDFKEATHINVRTIEAWVAQFARHGFFRDLDFDASFITPWAVRFVRRDPASITPVRLVREYERRFWELWKENTDLRALGSEQRDQISAADAALADLRARDHARDQREVARERELRALDLRAAALEQEIRAKNEHIAHLEDLIRRIESGRVLQALKGASTLLAVARQEGPLAAARALTRRQPPQPAAPASTKSAASPPIALSEGLAEYQTWAVAHEPTLLEREQQRQVALRFAQQPRISVIVPVFNPPLPVLQAAIESVRQQTYGTWELCLTDAGDDPQVRAFLSDLARSDARIRLRTLPSNDGISANANAALELATGEWVLFLDHDDLIAPDLMFEVVSLLQHEPQTDIVYYDEDKISADGRIRRDPWFKPSQFSPDLLLSANFLMHAVFRYSLLQSVGGLRSEYDGAQDWDLALRCSEQTTAIRHVHRVLYHWRQLPGSTAGDADAKPWAYEAQQRCLSASFARRGIAAEVLLTPQRRARVKLPCRGDLASIIIPNKDKADLIERCVETILQYTSYPAYEIIIVDTGSSDPATHDLYAAWRQHSQIRIIDLPGRFNYSYANNVGAKAANGELLVFLNNDTEVLAGHGDWLEELASWAEQPGVGAVGAKLLRPDRRIQHAGVVFGLGGHASHIFDYAPEDAFGPFGSVEWYRTVSAVTGACLALRRTHFEQVNGFDQDYRLVYSDIELCVRLSEQGLRCVYTPYACLLHHEGASRGISTPPADALRASIQLAGWANQSDPFFNPNLSSEARIPQLPSAAEQDRPARLIRIAHGLGLVPADAAPFVAQPVLRRHGLQHQDHPRQLLVVCPDLESGAAGESLARMLVAAHSKQGMRVVAAQGGPLLRLYQQAGIEVELRPDLLSDARSLFGLAEQHGVVLISDLQCWRAAFAARAAGARCFWWLHEPPIVVEQARQQDSVAQALGEATIITAAAEYLPATGGILVRSALHWEQHEPAEQAATQIIWADPIDHAEPIIALIEAIAGRTDLTLIIVGAIRSWAAYTAILSAARPHATIQVVGDTPYDQVAKLVRSAYAVAAAAPDPLMPAQILARTHHIPLISAQSVSAWQHQLQHLPTRESADHDSDPADAIVRGTIIQWQDLVSDTWGS
jgi:GT2 family glycosyltransferase